MSGWGRLFIVAAVVLPVPAASAWAEAARPVKAVPVDIRAFGDSGYIGGIGIYAPPTAGWVSAKLRGIEALKSPDVNFLNLEGSLTRSCRRFLDKPFTFAISPEALAEFGLWGFNLIGLANNHTLDCVDPPPGRETMRALADAKKLAPGIVTHGIAASTTALFGRPAILNVRGVRIGMVSLKAWGNGRRATLGNLDNSAEVMAGLAKASVDVRILSLHGGVENSRRPTEDVMSIAREFVGKYGGDVVFAHHPHKSQGFEVLTKKDGRTAVVFYSLGNGLHNGLSVNGDGLVARVAVDRRGVLPASLAVYPLARPALRPRVLRAAELKEVASILRDSSAAVALRALPGGITRVPFALESVSEPAAGLKLVVGRDEPTPKPALRPSSKASRRARFGAAGIASSRPAARWIPPPARVAH